MSDKETHETVVDGSPRDSEKSSTGNDAAIFHDDFSIQRPPRTIGFVEIISAGFNICNSWSGLAATMFLAIFQGGPVTILYGCIVIVFLMGSSALSLAEMAARYPTAGGQYHWTALLAPKKWSRGLSYACGSINFFGWIAICAGICIIIPQLVLGMAVFYNPTFEIHAWHSFLIYQALNILVLTYNLFVLRRASWTHDIGFGLSLLCFFVFLITCVAIASPKQPSSYVWTVFVNDSGWSNGVVFLTGLVNPAFMYSGLDGAIHLAEDALNASTAVPYALLSTIVIGFFTAFTFVIAMFYCISDFDLVLGTPTRVPIYEIWHQATKSATCATVFLVFLLFTGVFALNASQQTASRLTFAFARDNALVFSKHIGTIHRGLGVPVWALFFNSFIIFVIGCIYLGSTTAFSAIIGTGLVLQQITFAFPAALLMYRRRAPEFLPQKGSFNLGKLGWFFNAVTVAWAILSTVLFSMPLSLPVNGVNMNYTSAVLGAMALFSVINWFVYARKNYRGPRIDVARFQ